MNRKVPPFLYKGFCPLLLLLLGLSACADNGISTTPEYEGYKDKMYPHGSLLSEEGGFSFFGDDEEKKIENSGIGVNGYLWRASLDTLSFMPIASADPFGGLITTDWHSPDPSAQERIKLNVFILDRDLRADGVKVSVFKQTLDSETKKWADAPVSDATANALEETILMRARQLRMSQRDR